MLEYDRVDASEGIDTSKTTDLCNWYICYYWYFLKTNFKFQPKICNGCHNLTQKVLSFNDVAIVSVKENDYRTHKNEAIDLLRNAI